MMVRSSYIYMRLVKNCMKMEEEEEEKQEEKEEEKEEEEEESHEDHGYPNRMTNPTFGLVRLNCPARLLLLTTPSVKRIFNFTEKPVGLKKNQQTKKNGKRLRRKTRPYTGKHKSRKVGQGQ